MIEVIERVLNRENSDIKIKSKVLLDQLSQDRARRIYKWTMKTVDNLEAKCEREEGLITFQEFYDTLQAKPSLKQGFLPRHTDLKRTLLNTAAEREYTVSSQYRDDFVMFRYEMHSLMTDNMRLRLPNRKRGEYSETNKSEVFRSAGAGITGTSQIRSKAQKPLDLQRKEVPGIVKVADKGLVESGLPSQVWEFNSGPKKTYVRKANRILTNGVEVELKSRTEARRLMVPKSLAQQALEEIDYEMARAGSKKTDKAEEVTLVDTGLIVQKENDRLKSIPRYVIEKWIIPK